MTLALPAIASPIDIIAQRCCLVSSTRKGGSVARKPKPRINPPVEAGELVGQTQPQIKPPVEVGELAEHAEPIAPVPPVVVSAPSTAAVEQTAGEVLHQASPWLRKLGQWLLVLLAIYTVGWLLWSAGPALTPFIIGLVLAYLLMPIVDRLGERLPRWLAILLVYIGGIGLIALSVAFIIPPAADQVQQLFGSI